MAAILRLYRSGSAFSRCQYCWSYFRFCSLCCLHVLAAMSARDKHQVSGNATKCRLECRERRVFCPNSPFKRARSPYVRRGLHQGIFVRFKIFISHMHTYQILQDGVTRVVSVTDNTVSKLHSTGNGGGGGEREREREALCM